MSNVVDLPVASRLNADPRRVLEAAMADDLADVMICGYRKDGSEYFRTSLADAKDVHWLLSRMQIVVLRSVEDAPC